MYRLSCILIFLIIVQSGKAQIAIGVVIYSTDTKLETGKDLLNAMHQKYRNGPCRSYTFSQKNTHFRNDSVIGNSEWHEYIEFPDKFRIDFGKPETGNFVVFKNDSSYRYKNNQLKKKTGDSNILLLLLGGMYYRDINDVITRLEKGHYDTQILSEQKWKTKKVYVIGALKGDTVSNQIWVDKKTFRVIRIIEKMDTENTMDMSFDAFQKSCHGYTETKVTFKRNGKKEQVEEYFNIQILDKIPADIFNPK